MPDPMSGTFGIPTPGASYTPPVAFAAVVFEERPGVFNMTGRPEPFRPDGAGHFAVKLPVPELPPDGIAILASYESQHAHDVLPFPRTDNATYELAMPEETLYRIISGYPVTRIYRKGGQP